MIIGSATTVIIGTVFVATPPTCRRAYPLRQSRGRSFHPRAVSHPYRSLPRHNLANYRPSRHPHRSPQQQPRHYLHSAHHPAASFNPASVRSRSFVLARSVRATSQNPQDSIAAGPLIPCLDDVTRNPRTIVNCYELR